MKKCRSLLSSSAIFYTFITVGLLLIAVFPLYRKISLTPPGHSYTMAQVRIADFYIYQAVMGQGARGHWLVEHPYVNEPHQRTLVYFYFIILGKIAPLLGIANSLMYFLAIYANLIGLVLSVIWLLKTVFPGRQHKQVFAFLLIFFSGTWPNLSLFKTKVDFYQDWPWTLQWGSIYHRLTHVPHHTLAEIFLIISVILLIRFWEERRLIWAVIAGILQAFSAIIFPAPTLVLVFVFMVAVYLLLIVKGRKRLGIAWRQGMYDTVLGIFLFLLLAVVPLIFLQRQLGSGYPWSLEKATVGENYIIEALRMDVDYLLMFGPLILLTPLAFNKHIFNSIANLLVWLLFLAPLILMPIVPFFGLPSWRVVTAAPFVWGGILATFGIDKFCQLARQYGIKRYEGCLWVMVVGILLVSLPQSLFYWWREAQPLFPSQIYIPQAGMEALKVLDRQAKEGDVVLSLQHLGIFIPAVTRAKGFMAVPPWTYKLNEKFAATRAFYNGEMSDEKALKFLKENNIKFVFIGWDEKAYWQKVPYDFLEEIYKKDGIVLYQLIK